MQQIDQKRTNANVTKVLSVGKLVCNKLSTIDATTSAGTITLNINSFNLNVHTIPNAIQFNPLFVLPQVLSTKKYGQIMNHAIQLVTTQELFSNIVYTIGTISNPAYRPINDSANVHLGPINIEIAGIIKNDGSFNVVIPTGLPFPAGSLLKFNFTYTVNL